ncbi:hypothetical protein GCM10008955_33010 [Deinococcus malanensis]|uniref:PDZ domain-containing protein n=1 Tax=Deinococcus malanensis TaxID=1706855 RepID=A0ABQ2F128_9DEIO|nr:hypothetical protein GCM10008955_33010 [Deinococcus malanensis]
MQVLSLTFALSGVVLGGGAAGPSPVDAYAVFDTGARLLRTYYAGPNMGLVDSLLTNQRKVLVTRCATTTPCPLYLGRDALEVVMNVFRYQDGHNRVDWEAGPLPKHNAQPQPVAPPKRVWTGMLARLLSPADLLVVHVDHGSPAERAGLRAGDVVLAVGAQDDLGDAELRSSFLADVERTGEPFTLRVRRGSAERTVTVAPALWTAGGQPSLRWEGKSAIISVPSFNLGSGAAFNALVTRAVTQGANGLVVDLRWNPGGGINECLEAAQSLAGESVNLMLVGRSGLPVYEWRTSAEAQAARSRTAMRWNGPLALLVSPWTMSCGEVLAYFSQRAGGTVVGSETRGVMRTGMRGFDLPGGGVLYMSIVRGTLDGRVQLPGRVVPDVAVTDEDQESRTGRDAGLDAALKVVRSR